MKVLGLWWNGMVASQHHIRIGLTQSPLKTSVPDVFAFLCSSMPKSTRFARQFIRLICILKQASNPASSHKPSLRVAFGISSYKKAHAVCVGFVTPSAGSWLRLYSLVFLYLLGFHKFTCMRIWIFAHPCAYKRTRCLNNVLPHFLILVSPLWYQQ